MTELSQNPNEALQLKIKHAALVAENMQFHPDYPLIKYRNSQNLRMNRPLTIPEGAWSTPQLNLPTAEEARLLAMEGCTLDEYKRPLHPWLSEMIQPTSPGVVTNKGYYWKWGPNKTADPIVIARELTKNYVLLIQRSDTGDWALPGGFIDSNEAAVYAAAREGSEEAHIELIPEQGILLYQGVVADPRTTAHAWPETSAYVWHIPKRTSIKASSDAKDTWWCPLEQLPKNLYGSHKILIEEATHGTFNY